MWEARQSLVSPTALGHQSAISLQAMDSAAAEFIYSIRPTTALITFHVDHVSLADRRVHGTVFIDVPMQLMADLVDKRTGQPIQPTDLVNPDKYGPLVLTISLEGSHDPTTVLAKPFSDYRYYQPGLSFPSHPGIYGIVGDATFGLTGVVNRFPEDAYEVIIAMTISLPDTIAYVANGTQSSTLPAIDEATQDTNMTGYDSSVSFPYRGVPLMVLWIERTSLSALFTFALALMPLIIALVLFHLILVHDMDLSTTLKLLFAALFTILPLRAVLVPTEITSVTLLDSLLGAEVMVFLMVGAFAYWREMWQRRSPQDSDTASVK